MILWRKSLMLDASDHGRVGVTARREFVAEAGRVGDVAADERVERGREDVEALGIDAAKSSAISFGTAPFFETPTLYGTLT